MLLLGLEVGVLTQSHMDDILRATPPEAYPPTGDTEMEVALATTLARLRGILFATLVAMEQRPKPWSNWDKKLRLKVAKAAGIAKTQWEVMPDALQKAALRKQAWIEAPDTVAKRRS